MLRNTKQHDTVVYKQQAILDIIQDFPERKFILIGDSGEKDVDIYTFVKNATTNVVGIYIRDVGNPKKGEIAERAALNYVLFEDPIELLSIREI
jgi:phosphatidate phosphatase APP1